MTDPIREDGALVDVERPSRNGIELEDRIRSIQLSEDDLYCVLRYAAELEEALWIALGDSCVHVGVGSTGELEREEFPDGTIGYSRSRHG